MSKQPAGWDEALVNAGFVDPRNGNPSLNQLAIHAGIPVSTVAAVANGRRKPRPDTIDRIADALGVDVRTVSSWVGQERTERAPYQPPAEADLLTDRQRRAVDEIIRAIVAERVSTRDHRDPKPTPSDQRPRVAREPEQDGAITPLRLTRAEETETWAADEGERSLDVEDAKMSQVGEESQDSGTDEPA